MKFTAMLQGAVVLALSAVFAGSGLAADKIGIAQFGKHPQLDTAVDSFKKELADQGFTDLEFVESQVNFDTNLIPQMLTTLQAAQPKLILTVTTPVSQGAKQLLAGTGIPVIFTAVTDPVAAELVPAWDKADPMMTGASDLQDIEAVLEFSTKLFPGATRVGFPYNPGEANDVAALGFIKEAADKQGLEVVEVGIDSVNDIPARITSLKDKADFIYIPGSNLVQPAVPAVAASANQIGIPIVNASQSAVEDGQVVASFEVSYDQVGRNAGKLAAEFLKGKPLADLPPIKAGYEDHRAMINLDMLKEAGRELPDSLKDCNCFKQ